MFWYLCACLCACMFVCNVCVAVCTCECGLAIHLCIQVERIQTINLIFFQKMLKMMVQHQKISINGINGFLDHIWVFSFIFGPKMSKMRP